MKIPNLKAITAEERQRSTLIKVRKNRRIKYMQGKISNPPLTNSSFSAGIKQAVLYNLRIFCFAVFTKTALNSCWFYDTMINGVLYL